MLTELYRSKVRILLHNDKSMSKREVVYYNILPWLVSQT